MSADYCPQSSINTINWINIVDQPQSPIRFRYPSETTNGNKTKVTGPKLQIPVLYPEYPLRLEVSLVKTQKRDVPHCYNLVIYDTTEFENNIFNVWQSTGDVQGKQVSFTFGINKQSRKDWLKEYRTLFRETQTLLDNDTETDGATVLPNAINEWNSFDKDEVAMKFQLFQIQPNGEVLVEEAYSNAIIDIQSKKGAPLEVITYAPNKALNEHAKMIIVLKNKINTEGLQVIFYHDNWSTSALCKILRNNVLEVIIPKYPDDIDRCVKFVVQNNEKKSAHKCFEFMARNDFTSRKRKCTESPEYFDVGLLDGFIFGNDTVSSSPKRPREDDIDYDDDLEDDAIIETSVAEATTGISPPRVEIDVKPSLKTEAVPPKGKHSHADMKLIKSKYIQQYRNRMMHLMCRLPHKLAFGKSYEEVINNIFIQLPMLATVADSFGDTPLHNAILKDNTLAAEHLIITLTQTGERQLNRQNTSGHTPLILVANCDVDDNLAETLLRAGARLDLVDKWQATAVHYAVRNHRIELLKILVREAARRREISVLNILDGNNYTAVHYAILGKCEDSLRILLDGGADPNTTGKLGRETALHLAVRTGNLEMVRELVKHSQVDLNAQTSDGRSAMRIAIESEYEEIVALLKINNALDIGPDEEEDSDDESLVSGYHSQTEMSTLDDDMQTEDITQHFGHLQIEDVVSVLGDHLSPEMCLKLTEHVLPRTSRPLKLLSKAALSTRVSAFKDLVKFSKNDMAKVCEFLKENGLGELVDMYNLK